MKLLLFIFSLSLSTMTFADSCPVSCKAVNNLKADGEELELSQTLKVKCGMNVQPFGEGTLGVGNGSYSVVIKKKVGSRFVVAEKESNSKVKVIFAETNSGLNGIDSSQLFPFSSADMRLVVEAAGLNSSEIKTVQSYTTKESEYANIVIFKNASGKVIYKGSTIIDTADSIKLVSCK